MEKVLGKVARFGDELLLAAKGTVLASRKKAFLVPAVLSFLVFGIILNLFSGGFAAASLIFKSGVFSALKIIFNALVGVFGVNKSFFDWLPVFLMSLMQGILIGLVCFVYRKNKERAGETAGTAGIVAGLAILGSGCPTCGTTLIAPLVGTLFSGSGFAVAGTISGVITFLAVLIAILAFKKVGLETYAIIKSEKYEKTR